ncbi:protein of unknown function [Hyphomicrobium sp. 1Nfss2.1]
MDDGRAEGAEESGSAAGICSGSGRAGAACHLDAGLGHDHKSASSVDAGRSAPVVLILAVGAATVPPVASGRSVACDCSCGRRCRAVCGACRIRYC